MRTLPSQHFSELVTTRSTSLLRFRAYAVALLLLIAAGSLPLLIQNPNVIRLAFLTLIFVTAAIAWNILGGFTGQVSFGFAVFYGIGAYGTAIAIRSGYHPYLAYLVGALAATLASLIIGYPAFRLRGPYFAIATIGVSEAVRVIANNLSLTGGASGLRIVEHRPFSQLEHFYVALIVAGTALIVSIAIASSRIGLALQAIRDDQEAAAAIGINPLFWKLFAHGLAALLTALAGGVFARYAAFIHPGGVFAFETGVAILLMPVIGGLGTIWGPVLGGTIYGVVQEQLVATFPRLHLLLYGLLLIVVIILEPRGIIGIGQRLYGMVRRAPATR